MILSCLPSPDPAPLPLEILEDLVWPHQTLKDKYTDAKANIREWGRRIFSKAFPMHMCMQGVSGRIPLASPMRITLPSFDAFATVVEAKSATVTEPAKRGESDVSSRH